MLNIVIWRQFPFWVRTVCATDAKANNDDDGRSSVLCLRNATDNQCVWAPEAWEPETIHNCARYARVPVREPCGNARFV
jgi:hypothetical protein